MVDESTISLLTERLQADNVTLDASAIRAFVSEKENGASEAEFVADAMKSACVSAGEKTLQELAIGTALGAVTGPFADMVRKHDSSWRELVRRSPKTAMLGALAGAAAALAVNRLQAHTHREEAVTTLKDIQRDAHALERAWTTITTKPASEQAATSSRSSNLPLR